MTAPKIGIVGSGKVAQMLLRLASSAQIPVEGIYARSPEKADAFPTMHCQKSSVNSIRSKLPPTLPGARVSSFLHINNLVCAILSKVFQKVETYSPLISPS